MELTEKKMGINDTVSKKYSLSQHLEILVNALGGNENIISITHCMTRLRFKLVDESLVDKAALESIKGVKGVVLAQGQTQVVIGVEVEKWYNELAGISSATDENVIDKDN